MAERPTPEQLSPVMRAALLRGLTSRRSMMAGALGLGAAAALAACGSAGKGPTASGWPPRTTAAAAKDMSDTEKVVNWSNWTQYIDVSDDEKSRPTLDAFTKKTGIKVNYTEDYNDNDEFYAKVRPLLEGGEDTGRDVWCSTDWMVARLIRQGYVQKLDPANIPNAANLEPSLKNVEFDPGRIYSLPWQSGFAGIAYNLDATGGKKIETIDPAAHRPGAEGQGHPAHRDARHRRPGAAASMGKDISNFTDADFIAAIASSRRPRTPGQIKGFTGNEYTERPGQGRHRGLHRVDR